MMLQALVALAERRGLLDDPSYANRKVHYQLRISDDGRALALIPLGEEGRGEPLEAPVAPKRSGNIAPAFVVDTAQWVFGLPKRKKGEVLAPASATQASTYFDAFVRQVCVAAEATHDEGLAAYRRFLERVQANPEAERARLMAMDRDHEWTGDECIAAIRDSDGLTYIHQRAPVRDYWARRYIASGAHGEAQRCLVTGQLAVPVRLHSNVKGLPKPAKSSGAALVSFNASAFESHHFEQGSNAPVSQRAADGYVRALNWLLERQGERRFRSGLPLGSDAVLVFWTRDDNDTADVLLSLLSPEAETDEDLRAVFEAAWKGLAPREIDATKFFGLTLSGNASRVVVRDWLETTAADVKANVRRYFEDLALDEDIAPLPIRSLLRSLEATPSAATDKRGLSPVLATRLIHAALRGSPFPRELLHSALARLRVPPGEREWRGTLRARVAIVKATLLRLHPAQEVTVSLDETNHSVPYLLGRLFAAIEKLQADALGDINASLRDRYFGSASATPALVFPRLLRLSMHHASKAESEHRGWAERIKAEIVNRLPAQGAFPRTLDLVSQGLFAVGYYHQRQAFFTPRKSAESESIA
jgi:CRISPR-associated protein Csd1